MKNGVMGQLETIFSKKLTIFVILQSRFRIFIIIYKLSKGLRKCVCMLNFVAMQFYGFADLTLK